jgi:hypothetical protein
MNLDQVPLLLRSRSSVDLFARLHRSFVDVLRGICSMPPKKSMVPPEDGGTGGSGTSLSPKTLVPLGAVAGTILTVVSATFYMTSEIRDVHWEILSLKKDVESVSRSAKSFEGDFLTRKDFLTWLWMLRAKNPNLEVPEDAVKK